MFKLKRDKEGWFLIYTQEHSTEDISYMGDLLSTIERVHKKLAEDELFSIMELNIEDTLNLLRILGETEKCTGWNMFDVRDTDEIISSLVNLLYTYRIYVADGVEISNW